jgi:hypothetical protein
MKLLSVCMQVMQEWMVRSNKNLTNYQHRVVMNSIAVCSSPLFCKISFTEVGQG